MGCGFSQVTSRLGVYYGEWREDQTDRSWMPNWADVQRATETQVNPRWRACEPPEPTQGMWSLCICCLCQRSSVHWEYLVRLFVCQAIRCNKPLLAVTVPVRDVWLAVQVNGGVLPLRTNSTTLVPLFIVIHAVIICLLGIDYQILSVNKSAGFLTAVKDHSVAVL